MESLIRHDSRDSQFRSPPGAVPPGTAVTLSVLAEGAASCVLLLAPDGGQRVRIPMTAETGGRFTARITAPETVGLLWYAFEADFGGVAVCYGNNPQSLGGEGAAFQGEGPWYQITVYEPSETPAWYRDGLVYQIFPDRFCRGQDFPRRWADKCASPLRGGARYVLSQDWDDLPFYTKRDDGLVSRWQFYGGTLEGIRERLPYLRSLGVTVLYLNPIFLSASNHRYDTGDYFTVDPLLGDEASFRALAESCRDVGIRILLDGVFSHTGADSRYFNRFGSFPAPGACQSIRSSYYSWYRFRAYPEDYECWWDVKDLPNVNELDPGYLEFICGVNGVVRHWLRLGASGWRLDVADELPEPFLRAVRAAALAEKPDALILGEVWEDASNKVSYGVRRSYLLGQSLHSVMNYPFRQAVLDFLLCRIPAAALCAQLLSLWENYPPSAMYGALNLLGSHDRARVLTLLGEPELPETAWGRESLRLNPERYDLACRRLRLFWAIQMATPGVPCLYYGDEAGLQGLEDPWNRGSFPWGHEDESLTQEFRQLAALRREHPALISGDFTAQALGDDVLLLTRSSPRETVSLLVNRARQPRCTGASDQPPLPGLEFRLVIH